MNEGDTKISEDDEAYLRIWTALTDADLPLPRESLRALRTALAAAQTNTPSGDEVAASNLRRAIEAAKEN